MSSSEGNHDELADDETPTPGSDLEVPEADALDQAREVEPAERHGPITRPIDAPEADALDQAIEVPLDEDEGPGGSSG
jgi:hypothetical protein